MLFTQQIMVSIWRCGVDLILYFPIYEIDEIDNNLTQYLLAYMN